METHELTPIRPAATTPEEIRYVSNTLQEVFSRVIRTKKRLYLQGVLLSIPGPEHLCYTGPSLDREDLETYACLIRMSHNIGTHEALAFSIPIALASLCREGGPNNIEAFRKQMLHLSCSNISLHDRKKETLLGPLIQRGAVAKMDTGQVILKLNSISRLFGLTEKTVK